MSFRVLVIPEDPTNNGYILKPLVERLLAECGKPKAVVKVLTNPKVGGYEQAVAAIRSELFRYRFMDLWLFLPDADMGTNLDALEGELNEKGIRLLCCAAVPEAEAWLLAGHRDKLGMAWNDVRAHGKLKEDVFEPFLAEHGNPRAPGKGRADLMRSTICDYNGLVACCPELLELKGRIEAAIIARDAELSEVGW